MIPVRGATGARGCCARCWGSRGCPARRRQHRPRRPRNCVVAGGRTRPRGMPGCTTAMAAGPWAARGGPGRGRLAQLHRGAMGAHEWFLRPWLRLCARGGRCAHPAGDAHPLGHSETAGCLPPGSPPAGATAARVTRQCRCAQGAGGRGQGAGARVDRTARQPQAGTNTSGTACAGGAARYRRPVGMAVPRWPSQSRASSWTAMWTRDIDSKKCLGRW